MSPHIQKQLKTKDKNQSIGALHIYRNMKVVLKVYSPIVQRKLSFTCLFT